MQLSRMEHWRRIGWFLLIHQVGIRELGTQRKIALMRVFRFGSFSSVLVFSFFGFSEIKEAPQISQVCCPSILRLFEWHNRGLNLDIEFLLYPVIRTPEGPEYLFLLEGRQMIHSGPFLDIECHWLPFSPLRSFFQYKKILCSLFSESLPQAC